MPRLAYLLGPAILGAVALQLQDLRPVMETSLPAAVPSVETYSMVQRLNSPAPINSSLDTLLPAQPQRWVF